MAEQDKTTTPLEISVIYLGNAYQPQHVFIQVPENKQEEQPKNANNNEISQENLDLLKNQFNLQEVQVEENQKCEIPSFVPAEYVDETLHVLNIADPKERQLKLYALFQSSPQMFGALNKYLPPEYQLSEDIDFQNLHKISIPIMDIHGNVERTVEKMIQLSPYYLKEHPPQIKDDCFDCFSFNSLIGNDEDEQTINNALGCNVQVKQMQSSSALMQNKLMKQNMTSIQPKGNPIVHFSFLIDEDKQELQLKPKKSVYVEQYKEKIKSKFLQLINTKYKQLYTQELVDVLQTLDTRKQSAEQFEIAVTLLYFDKLDIISIFQQLQQLNSSQVGVLRNYLYGWPTMYPVKNQEQSIQQIMQNTEKRYQDCRNRTSNLTEIYLKIFTQNKKIFENQLPRPFQLPKIFERIRTFPDKDVQMYEYRFCESNNFSGTINIPKQLFDEGFAEKSPYHKTFMEYVQQAINIQRQQKQKRPIKEVKEVIPEEEEYIIKKWKKPTYRKIQLKLKLSDKEQVSKLIHAGKMNTITIFDLDNFLDLTVTLCNQDLNFHFYYDELQQRASFGQQMSLIKAPKQTYLILLRFMFCNYDYLKRNKLLSTFTRLYKLATTIPTEQLQDTISIHALIEEHAVKFASGRQEMALDQEEANQSGLADFLLPSMLMTYDLFQKVIDGNVGILELVRECVDKLQINYTKIKDIDQINCSANCVHSKTKQFEIQIDDMQEKKLYQIQPCQTVYDEIHNKMKAGFILFSKKDIFEDERDDPQLFTFVTNQKEYQNDQLMFKEQNKIDECFYQFFNYSTFYNSKTMNYCVLVLQLIELYVNSNKSVISTIQKEQIDEIFSNYYSCRHDSLLMIQESAEKLWEKYSLIQKMIQKCNSVPKTITVENIRRLLTPYDRITVATDLFARSLDQLEYKIQVDNFCVSKMLSSFFNPRSTSLTTTSIIYHNLIGPEQIQDMLQQSTVDKEGFTFPINESAEIEAEVDINVLKKDNIITKLKTFGQSYKVMPDDMYKLMKKQHPEMFDIGSYDKQPYKTPNSFQETKQLANSVLNRGKYFTIPFGSEASRHTELVEPIEDYETTDTNELTSLMGKHKQNQQQIIKSQYLKWAGPTGAEAQVCHIEEEQLCFGLFKVRANNLMKILLEWMAIYTPAMLKFFDCCLTTTAMDACPDSKSYFTYRIKVQEAQEKQTGRSNQYFYSGEYKAIVEDNEDADEEEDSDAPAIYQAFSFEFDNAIQDILQVYNQLHRVLQQDEFLNKSKVEFVTDAWAKGCFAPIQQWPYSPNTQFTTPPPPYIPAILQNFLSQLYTTGEILDEMFKNTIVAIPVIARTVQMYIAFCRQAEQRAAAVWRTLYPDAYYRSIDHANVCLQLYDKKFMQPKQMILDLSRRIQNCEQGHNPNQEIDSAIDFCLPRVFDVVNFSKYADRMKEPELQHLISYQHRLQVEQSFYPASQILMPFRFNCFLASSILQKLSQESSVGSDWRDISVYNWKKLISNIFNADQMIFSTDYMFEVLQLGDHEEMYEQLYQVFPNVNWSVLFTQSMIGDYMMIKNEQIQNQQSQQQKPKADELAIDENDVIYMEDLVYDLCQYDQLAVSNDSKLYPEQFAGSMADFIKQLKFDNVEVTKGIKQTLDECFSSNKIMASLFNDKHLKQSQQIYTKQRNLSMPTVTNRSLYLLRCSLFNEELDKDFIMQLVNNSISNEKLAQHFRDSADNLKSKYIRQIMGYLNQQQQRNQAASIIPNIINDLSRKQIFDEFLVPLMQNIQENNGSRVRYIDSELYQMIRFLAIACYRLEYCLKILEELSPQQRQCAVYGTKMQNPIPFSFQNQCNLGMSLFGNNIIEFVEQQTGKPLLKCQQEAIPLSVSQRVLNGHQPYGNLLNTSDPSINGCICCCITCPFCGGIGAGLNGTLSGNINMKVAAQQMVEMDTSLVNGVLFMGPNQFNWNDVVFMRSWRNLQAQTSQSKIMAYYNQNEKIGLIYKLQSIIPQYQDENHIFQYQDESQKQKLAKLLKKEVDDYEMKDTLRQLMQWPKIDGRTYFVSNFGYRLADTTLLPPPPDSYSLQFMMQHIQNPFVRDYLLSSYKSIQTDSYRCANCIQNLFNIDMDRVSDKSYKGISLSVAVDDPIYMMLMNRQQVLQLLKPEEIQAFYSQHLLRKQPDQAKAFKDINYLQYSNDILNMFQLLIKSSPNSKEDYISDQTYSILGIHGYVFLSLKKLITNIYKRIELQASKMASQHYDLINMQYFRSSKCSLANNLTTSLLMFGIWQNLQVMSEVHSVIPIQFGPSLMQQMRDLRESLFMVENYQGFMNMQLIYFELDKSQKKQ